MTDNVDAAAESAEPTLQDALDGGVLAIVNASDGQDPYTLLAALNDLMVAKREGEQIGQAKAAELLIWCYSMRLDAGSKMEPFQPARRLANGKTSAKPYHLSADQVQLIAGLYPQVLPAARRAHLADLVSLMSQQSRIEHVIAAIDAYTATPLNDGHWYIEGQQHWHRALALANAFFPGTGNRPQVIERELFKAFETACEQPDGSGALGYLRPLQVVGVRAHAAEIAARLEELAEGFKSKNNLTRATDVFEVAAYWYGRAKKPQRAMAMLYERAAATETLADGLSVAAVRRSFYTDSLRFYREINCQSHEDSPLHEAIERVKHKIGTAGIATIAEMSPMSFPGRPIDISEEVKDAVLRVAGKSVLTALIEFVELDQWPSHTAYLEQVRANTNGNIFDSLMGSTRLASDGRQIDNVGPLTGDEKNDALVLASKAIEAFVVDATFTARKAIDPALSQIYMEHALTLEDFQVIAGECPIVPLSHANAIAQGLYAGYQRDLLTALHILMPQFENIVRMALKSAGAITAKTDNSGNTMELGLSALIDRPQMETTFGADLTFGIRALMCEQIGPNLRNDIAHGLASTDSCNTMAGLYTWWFVFKLIFTQWHLAGQAGAADSWAADEANSPFPAQQCEG
ncbi:MAG: DUF4209 domain-containing protein [Pseudomonadota bacterium]